MTSEKLPISVTIITKNESVRIEAAIRSVLPFASEIIVLDSLSTDETVSISQALGAKVFVEAFRGFGQQKNRAASLASEEWTLNIDADERVSPQLEAEIRARFQSPEIKVTNGYYLPRKTWYLNRWVMHGGWYPNHLVRLARRNQSKWTEPALHEALIVTGKTEYFKNALQHFSFPTQRSHILKNIEYADHARVSLSAKGKRTRIIDLTVRPLWKFFDIYILKCGFLDGAAGFFIAIHSAYALFLRYTYLYEQTSQNSHPRQ